MLIDQCVKFAVKTNMYLGETIDVTDWFKIAFIENNGAAFGMELGSKLFLTIFRIFASIALGWALWYICKRPQYKMGFIASVALIEAGAIGNIIDCLFYGLQRAISSRDRYTLSCRRRICTILLWSCGRYVILSPILILLARLDAFCRG